MVVYIFMDGNVKIVSPENVYQGSNVTEITLLAPFPDETSVSVGFELPDGTIPEKQPMSYTQTIIDGQSVRAYVYKLPYAVTEQSGNVKMSFIAKFTNGQQTSYMANFEVQESVLPLPPENPDKDTYDLLLQYYQDAKNSAIAAQDAAEKAQESALDANDTANAAEEKAEGAVSTASQALETAQAVESKADSAVSTAEDAETKADNAVSTASAAATTANAAMSTATSAVSTANSAESKAESAVSTAEDANQTAENALSAASSAQNVANAASDTASQAQSVAEGIDGKASQALEVSKQASDTAENAQIVANGIDGKASEALTNSEQAVSTANEAKKLAEQAVAGNGTEVYVDNTLQSRVDFKSDPQTQINNIVSGAQAVGKATADADGNVIPDTYALLPTSVTDTGRASGQWVVGTGGTPATGKTMLLGTFIIYDTNIWLHISGGVARGGSSNQTTDVNVFISSLQGTVNEAYCYVRKLYKSSRTTGIYYTVDSSRHLRIFAAVPQYGKMFISAEVSGGSIAGKGSSENAYPSGGQYIPEKNYADLGQVVRVDAAQSLTDSEKRIVASNIARTGKATLSSPAWYKIAEATNQLRAVIVVKLVTDWENDRPFSSIAIINNAGNQYGECIISTIGNYGHPAVDQKNIFTKIRLNGSRIEVYYNTTKSHSCSFEISVFEISGNDYNIFNFESTTQEEISGSCFECDFVNGTNTSGAVYQQGSPVLVGDQSAIFESDGTTVKKASKLATPRALPVNLALSSGNAKKFDGSADTSLGVTGTLPVANGGTGQSNLDNVTVGNAKKATADANGNVIPDTYATKAEATRTATYTQQGQVKMASTTNGNITDADSDDVVPTIKNICDWTKRNFLPTNLPTDLDEWETGTSGGESFKLAGAGWYAMLYSNLSGGTYYNPGIFYYNGGVHCLPLCIYKLGIGYARVARINSDNTINVFEVTVNGSSFSVSDDLGMQVWYKKLA